MARQDAPGLLRRLHALRPAIPAVALSLLVLVVMVPTAPSHAAAAPLTADQEQALRAAARGETSDWPGLSAAQSAALFAKVDAYSARYRKVHLPHGQNADIRWNGPDRSEPAVYEGIGDSAAWTGHYLAALAFQYKVTGEARLLTDILGVLDTFDRLTRVTGRPGYIARFAAPADDPAYERYYRVYGRGEDPDRPGLGKSAYRGVDPWAGQVWLGNSSRDTYDGVGLGLAMVWAHVEDPGVRERVRTIVERVVNRLIGDEWRLIDGKGHQTRPTPWWNLAWLRIALSVAPEKFAPLAEDYEDLCGRLVESGARVRDRWTKEYFPNNLMFARILVLCTLEDDPAKRDALRNVLRDMYQGQARDHLNAHFAAVYTAGASDPDDSVARATLQGMLADYPDPPKLSRAVDHRGDAGIETKNDSMTLYALLTRERPPVDFLWQRSPCLIQAGYDAPVDEFPALDLILPYWIGRSCGAIPAP